jgi:hypothetical protein
MDTANAVYFSRPASWSSSFYNLSGVPDSTYRYRDIQFCNGGFLGQQPKADILYPKEPMQAYELTFSVADPTYNYYGFYSWGKTIPTNPLFLEPSYINVTNSDIDNLAVTFGGPVSYYHADFTVLNTIFLSVYASPDSASVHPLTTLNNQKCKWLSGVNVGNAKFGQITAERAPGYTYSTYMQYVTDSTKVQKHQLNFSSFIIKHS